MFRFSQLYFHITIDFASQLFLGKDTHNSSLMSYELLRSDEIWTVNKTEEGISAFSRFDETFNPRFDKILQPSYLKGDFKGIPKFDEEELLKLIRLLR